MLEYNPNFYWASPIIEVRNPDHARLKADLVRLSYENERRSTTAIASGVAPFMKDNLYESPFDFFDNPEPAVQELRAICVNALAETVFRLVDFMHKGTVKADRLIIDAFESWIHITRDGGYHDAHIHPNCSWCGIYYVEAGDCTLKPANGVNRFYPPPDPNYGDFGTQCFPLHPLDVAPEDGKMVLFPSHIRHSGVLYRGMRDRILVSFNARVNRAEG